MTEVPGHIARIPTEKGILPFVTERYRELGITADPMELFNQAADLRSRNEKHHSYAKTAVPLGAILLIVAIDAIRPIEMPSDGTSVVEIRNRPMLCSS